MIRKKPRQESEPIERGIEEATFAGGCFWGIELSFQRVPGVLHTEVGYTQGHTENPVRGCAVAPTTYFVPYLVIIYIMC